MPGSLRPLYLSRSNTDLRVVCWEFNDKARCRFKRLPSVTAACALPTHLPAVAVMVVSIAIISTLPVVVIVPVVSVRDMSRTVLPGAGHPDPASRINRPITGYPDITYARAGRGGLYHGNGRRYNGRCINYRWCNYDRHRQPEGEAEVNSGVGRHGSRADQRSQEYDFCFHMFFSGALLPTSIQTGKVTG